MKAFKIFTITTVVSIALISCKKSCHDPMAHNYSEDGKEDNSLCVYDHDHHHDHDAVGTAMIMISSLNDGDTIASGSMAMVHGTITGTETLHGYDVSIYNMTGDTTVYIHNESAHSTSYSLNHHWTNDVSVTSAMKAKVVAYLNHEHTILDSLEINFVCL